MSKSGIELVGRVCTGSGEGAKFTQLPWAMREFKSKLGFTPYPGTFNLHLEGEEWLQVRARLMAATGVTITPEEGFCSSKCFPVLVENEVEGAVVLPEVEEYPREKFEVLTTTAIRETLNARDGDELKVRVWLDPFQLPLDQVFDDEEGEE